MEYKEALYLGILRMLNNELPIEQAESYWENKHGLFDREQLYIYLSLTLGVLDERGILIFNETFPKPVNNKQLLWTDIITYITELNDLPSAPLGATYGIPVSQKVNEETSEDFRYYIQKFKALQVKAENNYQEGR